MNRHSKKRTADEAATGGPDQGEARLELEVITGSLWQPSCQALDPVPSKIPLVFENEAQYRNTFRPLLLEEARGSLRAEFDEAAGASKGWEVTITRCAPAKDGIFHLTLRPGDRGHAINLREGAIVVLIKPGEPGGGGGPGPAGPGPGPGSMAALARMAATSGRWSQQQQQGADAVAPLLAAMVRIRCRDAGQSLEVSVRPCCGNEAHKEDGSPCNRALHMMIGAGANTESADVGAMPSTSAPPSPTTWLWLVPLTSLITNVRELRVLSRLGDIALLPELLRPTSFGVATASELPQVWPQDARHELYYQYLYGQYDVPQREAIVAAAAHLATPQDIAEAMAQGIATGGAGGAKGDGAADGSEGGSGGGAAGSGGGAGGGGRERSSQATGTAGGQVRPLVPPITLVQGPPGTGKTHTVRGILNTWHSIMYHRHHSAWLRRAREILTGSGSGSGCRSCLLDRFRDGGSLVGASADAILDELSYAPLDAPKPRILVCAPSNAATDELLDRILTDGFCDFGGATYRPNVVRVGAEEAPLSAAVKAVWTEAMISRYESMGPEAWALAYKDCEARIANCKVYMAAMASKMAAKGSKQGGGGAAGEGGGGEGDGETGSQELDRAVADLVRLNDHLTRAKEEMSRLDRAGDLATSGPNRLAGYVVRRIREDLELSLMEEAEMVFTTLSSTGRAVFSRLGRGFDFVLIDEAAQASEIAALQPLLYGCRRLVMVGDPQQLPATLFSAAAKETLLERSLFERLAQAGTAVKMLSVQYRMHPEIRTFPSSYFYNDRLADGESVLVAAAQPPPYYDTDLLKPYVVYDVCNGRDFVQGRSRSNEAEADMALGLYLELLATVRGCQGIGAAAAAAASIAAAAGSTGGCRGLPEPTPPPGGGGAAGSADGAAVAGGGRAASVPPGGGSGGDGGGGPPFGQLAAGTPSFLAGYTLGVSVGIITPYRAQRELLRRKFTQALGPGVLDAVRIETVDSFQGKQLDVIILSCVRTIRPGASAPNNTGPGGGVGFLADVRRMNVAITRAKQSLWVLGHFAALRREPSWAALISDAEARSCVIEDANAAELCPEWAAFQDRFRAAAAGGGGGGGPGGPRPPPPQTMGGPRGPPGQLGMGPEWGGVAGAPRPYGVPPQGPTASGYRPGMMQQQQQQLDLGQQLLPPGQGPAQLQPPQMHPLPQQMQGPQQQQQLQGPGPGQGFGEEAHMQQQQQMARGMMPPHRIPQGPSVQHMHMQQQQQQQQQQPQMGPGPGPPPPPQQLLHPQQQQHHPHHPQPRRAYTTSGAQARSHHGALVSVRKAKAHVHSQNPHLQPQPLPGQQAHQQQHAAAAPAAVGGAQPRGRGLVSMLPKHGRGGGGGRGAGRGRGDSKPNG